MGRHGSDNHTSHRTGLKLRITPAPEHVGCGPVPSPRVCSFPATMAAPLKPPGSTCSPPSSLGLSRRLPGRQRETHRGLYDLDTKYPPKLTC